MYFDQMHGCTVRRQRFDILRHAPQIRSKAFESPRCGPHPQLPKCPLLRHEHRSQRPRYSDFRHGCTSRLRDFGTLRRVPLCCSLPYGSPRNGCNCSMRLFGTLQNAKPSHLLSTQDLVNALLLRSMWIPRQWRSNRFLLQCCFDFQQSCMLQKLLCCVLVLGNRILLLRCQTLVQAIA